MGLFDKIGRISYKTKLLLSYALLITIPMIISSLLIYHRFLISYKESSSTLVEQRISQEVNNINDTLDTLEKVSFQLSSNTTLISFLNEEYDPYNIDSQKKLMDSILPQFIWIRAANPNIAKINVLTLNDSISETNMFVHASRLENEDWYNEIREKAMIGFPYWEGCHIQQSYKTVDSFTSAPMPVYSLFCIMNSVSKANTTYLEFQIRPDMLYSSLNLSPIGKSGYLAVLDDKGDFIWGKNDKVLPTLLQDKSFLYGLNKQKGEYYYTYNKINYNINFHKIEKISTYIVSIVPTTEITQLFNKSKENLIYTVIITFLLLLGLAYYFGSLLTKKIKKIAAAFRKFQEGNFSTKIAVKGSDELDQLSLDFNTMASNISELINKVYKAEIAQKQAEIASLQAQIKPHFIYNTLESLKMIAELHDEDEISDGLTALGNLIRQNTHAKSHLTDIDTELENLSDYIKIQNLIRNNCIKERFDIYNDIGTNKILNLVLQPIVENCIVHGMKETRKILEISVTGEKIGNRIFFTIYDNGRGIDGKTLERLNQLLDNKAGDLPEGEGVGGIGLFNVHKRIKLYFGEDYGISIKSLVNEWTEITVKIPTIS